MRLLKRTRGNSVDGEIPVLADAEATLTMVITRVDGAKETIVVPAKVGILKRFRRFLNG